MPKYQLWKSLGADVVTVGLAGYFDNIEPKSKLT
jgi:hypothetical protein